MQQDRPSVTAQRVAMRRAVHQLLERPVVFEDPLAFSIIGRDAGERIRADHAAPEHAGSRFLRAFLAARSRYAEDQLAYAVRGGTRQYVVLGAGLDTFAYRNPHPELRVFEVDHPATQEWKRRRLGEAGIAIPCSVTFAPVDFERETVSTGLAHVGFDPRQPVFFSWLGVTPYLKPATVYGALREIASIAAGTAVVFDYAVPRESLDLLNRAAYDALAARVAAAGEPFRGFFLPNDLGRELQQMGFRSIEDLDGDAINRRYFQNRSDGFRVAGSIGHLVCAATSAS